MLTIVLKLNPLRVKYSKLCPRDYSNILNKKEERW